MLSGNVETISQEEVTIEFQNIVVAEKMANYLDSAVREISPANEEMLAKIPSRKGGGGYDGGSQPIGYSHN